MRLTLHRALSPFAMLIVVAGAPQSVSAGNGLEHLNQGAKGAGRAGSSTALADDAQSASRNPALLRHLEGTRLDATFLFNHERIRKRNATDNVLNERSEVWPAPFVAYSTDMVDDELAADNEDYEAPTYSLGFGLFQPVQGMLAPTATFAMDLSETISFGFSLNVLLVYVELESRGGSVGGSSGGSDFSPDGLVRIHYLADGTAVVPPQPFDNNGSTLTWGDIFEIADSGASSGGSSSGKEKPEISFEIDNLFGAGLAAQLGFLWTPREDLSIGFSVRTPGIVFAPSGKGKIDLTQAVNALANDPDAGLLIQSLVQTYLPDRGANGFKNEYDIETDDLILPATVSIGVAWWPLPRWVLTLDVRWIGWKGNFDEIKLKGTGGKNADLNEIAGGSSLDYTFRLDWRDQFVVAIGTTFAVTDWLLLRAGYNHGENPVPASTASATTLVLEDHLSVGVGFRAGNWDIDLAYVWGLPTQVDRERSSFKVELHQLYLGVGYRF
jgi:long-subunit fatty acid transport protein